MQSQAATLYMRAAYLVHMEKARRQYEKMSVYRDICCKYCNIHYFLALVKGLNK